MKAAHGFMSLAMVFLFVASGYAVTLHATDDTNINLNQPTQNNGTSVNVFVRNVGTGGVRHAFVRFELSILPPNTAIRRAVLKLWVRDITDPGVHRLTSRPRGVG
jgi:hypothetical protein